MTPCRRRDFLRCFQMTTIRQMQKHPRWPLYKKIRRAVAREISGHKAMLAHNPNVKEGDVDDFLREHLKEIQRDVRKLFRIDAGVREHGFLGGRGRVVAIESEE